MGIFAMGREEYEARLQLPSLRRENLKRYKA